MSNRHAALPRVRLPHTLGVVCGETGKAREDLIAALARRGWAGRVVWAFAPVQDRHAAPRAHRIRLFHAPSNRMVP